MVDFGAEDALGGDHWVLFWQEQLKLEETTLVGRVSGASNLHEEVPAVRLGRSSVDADNFKQQSNTINTSYLHDLAQMRLGPLRDSSRVKRVRQIILIGLISHYCDQVN